MIYWSGQLENSVKKKCKVILTIILHLYLVPENVGKPFA